MIRLCKENVVGHFIVVNSSKVIVVDSAERFPLSL